MQVPALCNYNLNISLSRFKCCISLKCRNREIEDCDARRWMCILELIVLQIIHFIELSLASKPGFFSNLNSPLMIQSFLCHQTVWINFTSDMILSRCFDFYMFMKFQMNGITSLHGMNKRHQETNYCAFDDNRKLRATKVAISFMLKAT